jgi:hypothetical protein
LYGGIQRISYPLSLKAFVPYIQEDVGDCADQFKKLMFEGTASNVETFLNSPDINVWHETFVNVTLYQARKSIYIC